MIEAERPPAPLESMPSNRRSEVRFTCRIKCYFTTIEEEKRRLEGGETWLIGKTGDLSVHGIALLARRPYPLGTTIAICPQLPGWNHERELVVRVTNVREEPEQGWCIGCEFIVPLSETELLFILGNAE